MQPKTKMSSGQATFDLEAARAVCDKIKRKNWNIDDGIDIRYLNIQCAEILPAALDEIERLQEKADRNRNLPDGETKLSTSDVAASRAKQIAKWQSEIDRLRKELESDKKFRCLSDRIKNQTIERQAKRIADLKAENENLREWGISNASDAAHEKVKTEKQLAALKKLGQAKRARGKALVEERISGEFSEWVENQCPHWDIDEEPFCVELDGPCEYHEGKCPISMELHRIAREQLRREGLL